jgi:hypothetical protein
MGFALKRINRNRRGRISSISFDLTKPCPRCDGNPEAQIGDRALAAIKWEADQKAAQ